jgi:RNA polymerase sigma-70 factor (ECF subfamily)
MNRSEPGENLSHLLEQEVRRLHEENAAGMLGYGLVFCGSREAAQDAVQEAFLRYFVARLAGQQINAPKAWLFRVVHNYLLDEKRSGSHRMDVSLEELLNAPEPRRTPDAESARMESLWLALNRLLSPRELECVRLRAEGLQYMEIANVLGLRVGTVGALLTRAHKKTRKLIKDIGGQEAEFGLKIAEENPYAS